ncbi:BOLA class I histocompatibility antigen, alpha chain BL3-7-like isoform X1, partial [Clarias magur]
THSLQYRYTPLIPGRNFTALGLVDGEPFMYYDSISKEVKPKTEWMKKLRDNTADYWYKETSDMEKQNDYFLHNLKTLMNNFSQSTEFPALERMYGCEYDDVTTRGYDEYKFNGEDFLSLNLMTAKWTAVNQYEWIIRDWRPDGDEAKLWKDFLKTTCIDRLKAYVSYGKESLPSKVGPSVSPGVVCFAPGFSRKDMTITRQQDGEILKVLSEELQKHKYTCGILSHSPVSEDQIQTDGEADGRPGAGSDGVVTGVIVCGILLALGAAAAGIVIWKKKSALLTNAESVVFSEIS